MAYTTAFTIHNTLHPSHKVIHSRVSLTLIASNNTILIHLKYYKSPIILATDGSYHAPTATDTFLSPQPHTAITGRPATSVVVVAINNTTQDDTWFYKPIIPLLARVQPLPTANGTNPSSNNSAELLARILVLELLLQTSLRLSSMTPT